MGTDANELTQAEREEGQKDESPSLCVGEGKLPSDEEEFPGDKPHHFA